MNLTYTLDMDLIIRESDDPDETRQLASKMIRSWDQAPSSGEVVTLSAGLLTADDGTALYGFVGQICEKAWSAEADGTLYLGTIGGWRIRVIGRVASDYFRDHVTRPQPQ